MSTEILINVTPFETRVARVEDGIVEDLYIERERERGFRGNIYKGRVQRVLPGIDAAFIDIGLPRAGFLYAGDVVNQAGDTAIEAEANLEQEESSEHADSDRRHNRRTIPPINTLLKEGQVLLVQVSKEPIASKGPRLTSLISLAGRYLVFLPNFDHVGIARRIEDPEERERLFEIARALKPDHGGLIVRTVAEGHHLFELQKDLEFLLRLWEDIERRAKHAAPGSLIHMELNLPLRVMRDFVDDEVEKIHVDSRETYENMKHFAKRFMPEMTKRIYYYPGERPIFDLYGVEAEINRALKRRVDLRSGGYIIIDQMEALTAIDVNSGSFVASRNLEETGMKTNLEAIHEIVHQIRLRNLGGIIVVDFIDMQEEENRKRLLEVLQETLKRDKAKTKIVQFSELGLVEMTRKRTRDSLGHILMMECPHCHGTGYVKSLTTICYQIFRALVAEARAYPCDKLMIIASPKIIDLLLGEEAENINRLETFLGKPIHLTSDPDLSPEDYEIALL